MSASDEEDVARRVLFRWDRQLANPALPSELRSDLKLLPYERLARYDTFFDARSVSSESSGLLSLRRALDGELGRPRSDSLSDWSLYTSRHGDGGAGLYAGVDPSAYLPFGGMENVLAGMNSAAGERDALVSAFSSLAQRTMGTPLQGRATRAMQLLAAVPRLADAHLGGRVWQTLSRATASLALALTQLTGEEDVRLSNEPAAPWSVERGMREAEAARRATRRAEIKALRARLADIAGLYEGRLAALDAERRRLEAAQVAASAALRDEDAGPAVTREAYDELRGRQRTLAALLRAELRQKMEAKRVLEARVQRACADNSAPVPGQPGESHEARASAAEAQRRAREHRQRAGHMADAMARKDRWRRV